MSVLETKRKMTSREQTAYDVGFHEGRNAAIVHGRWEHISDYGGGNVFGYCSNCKSPIRVKNIAAFYMDNIYCRYCGAKMDGDGNG